MQLKRSWEVAALLTVLILSAASILSVYFSFLSFFLCGNFCLVVGAWTLWSIFLYWGQCRRKIMCPMLWQYESLYLTVAWYSIEPFPGMFFSSVGIINGCCCFDNRLQNLPTALAAQGFCEAEVQWKAEWIVSSWCFRLCHWSFQLYGIGLYPYMQTHCFQLRNSNEKQKNGELEIIYLSKHTTD